MEVGDELSSLNICHGRSSSEFSFLLLLIFSEGPMAPHMFCLPFVSGCNIELDDELWCRFRFANLLMWKASLRFTCSELKMAYSENHKIPHWVCYKHSGNAYSSSQMRCHVDYPSDSNIQPMTLPGVKQFLDFWNRLTAIKSRKTPILAYDSLGYINVFRWSS